MDKPLISVIIPCFNQGQFLEECINSITSKLTSNIEIIVVDDGSTEIETLNVLNSFPFQNCTLIRQENQGPSAARNNGIQISKADLFIALDADDILKSDFIDKAYNLINNNSKIGVVYGDCEYFGDKNGLSIKQFNKYSQWYVNGLTVTALVRKELWKQCGGFDETMREGYEDWDFWIRAMQFNWIFEKMDVVSLAYRIKEKSTNSGAINKHDDLVAFIQKKNIKSFNDSFIALHRELSETKNNRRLLLRYLIRNILGKSNK